MEWLWRRESLTAPLDLGALCPADPSESGITRQDIQYLQGVFFNWAHPEFAKCRPVSN